MFRKLIIAILLLINPFILYSQNGKTSGPEIKIIYPDDKDTVTYNRIRIAGNTSPDANVTINDSKVEVYPSGAFVARVKLKPNWNNIKTG